MTLKLTPIDFIKNKNVLLFDGKPIFALRYECHHSKGYRGWDSIRSDLQKCSDCIDFLKENEKNPSTITWAVTTALIITYGRCFTSTDGNRTQLEQSDIPAEYLETHNRVMAFRNRYIAHASGAGEASYNIFGLYPNKKCKQILTIAAPHYFRLSGIGPENLNDLKSISEYLQKKCKTKMEKCFQEIVKKIHNLNLDELYENFADENLDQNYFPRFTPGEYKLHEFTLHPGTSVTVNVKQ